MLFSGSRLTGEVFSFLIEVLTHEARLANLTCVNYVHNYRGMRKIIGSSWLHNHRIVYVKKKTQLGFSNTPLFFVK